MGSMYKYEDYSGFIVTSKSKELEENTCGGRDSSKNQLENEPVLQIDTSPSFQSEIYIDFSFTFI